MPKRSRLVGPWHICSRCGTRFHIADMDWQRGLLLCRQYCFDTAKSGRPLIGQVEMAISQVFTNPSNELMPDPKLTNPDQIQSSMEDIIY
jgi:predicted  nucleic acid-binding Zn-ribbon protein